MDLDKARGIILGLAIGAAYLVKLALDGINTDQMITDLLSYTSGISDEFDAAVQKIDKCLSWDEEEKALAYFDEGAKDGSAKKRLPWHCIVS